MKTRNLIMFAVAVSLLASCNSGKSSMPEIEYVPFKTSANSDWGLMGTDGKVLFDDEFKYYPSMAVNGVFKVSDDDGVKYYSASENPELLVNESFATGGYYTEGVIPVAKENSCITLINIKGEEVAKLDKYKEKNIIFTNSFFTDGMLLFGTDDSKFGFVNNKGEVVVVPDFDYAVPYSEGLAIVGKYKKGDGVMEYSVIDTKGEPVAELKYDDFNPDDMLSTPAFSDGILVFGNKAVGRDGKILFRSPSDWIITDFEDGYANFYEDGKWGLIDRKGEVVIQADFDYPIEKCGNVFMTSEEGGYEEGGDLLFLDKEGKETDKIENIYNYQVLSDNIIIVSEYGNTDCYLVDNAGKPVNNENYNMIEGPDSFLTIQWVQSDYFPADEVVSSLLGDLDENGIGDFQFFVTVEDIQQMGYNLGDSDNYSYSYQINFEGIEGKYGFSTMYTAEFSDYVADYFDYNYQSYIESVLINIIYNGDIEYNNMGEKMNSAVKKYFEGKGYQCVAEDIADTIGDKYDTWDCYQTPSGVGLAVSSDATQIIMTIAG